MISTTVKRSSRVYLNPYESIEVDFGKFLKPMNDDEFFDFCQRHKDLRIEMEENGEIIIMPPTGSETGGKNFTSIGKFAVWVEKDGSGKGFDSSTGFRLPNGKQLIQEAIEFHLEDLRDLGASIPKPSSKSEYVKVLGA